MSRRVVSLLLACSLVSLAACQTIEGEIEQRTDPDGGGNGDASSQTIDDTGGLGSAASDILRPEPFTQITLEIAHTPGDRPAETATSHAVSSLEEVTGKQVTLDIYEIASGDGSYSADEIRSLSAARRTSSKTPTASIWIAYLDGESSDNPSALGIAVAATVAAVFPEKIGGLVDLVHPGSIERAVLLHEIGHLLALVNIGYQSERNHEDPDHANHSSNRGSVMYWAVEDISVTDVFQGGPPEGFDADDLADLELLRNS